MGKRIYILISAILLATSVFSQTDENKIQFSGFVDTYHAVRTKSPNDFMSSRTRFRGELQKAFGKSSMFISFNLNQNSLLKELNGFELREAYFDYATSNWNLRAGRQLIIWGAADGLRITDLVSPMDLTEFLARDYDDIRMPVEALKFSYFNSIMKLEFVYIPVFKGFVLPTNSKNPWSMSLPQIGTIQTVLLNENKPDATFKNGEFGMRAAFALPSVDCSIAVLHTWNKMPIFEKKLQGDIFSLQPSYKRMTFIGGDISKPLDEFVLRGEIAYNFNKPFASKQPNKPSQKHNTIHYLAGIDWYAANNWTLSAQFSDEFILNYSDGLEQEESSPLMTLNISKTVLSNTLKFSDFIYADLKNKGFFNRFSTDYALTDQIHLLIGYDHFHGDKGTFSMYKNNSEVWIKAKYSF